MLEICAKFVQSKNEHCEQKELYMLYIKYIRIQKCSNKKFNKIFTKKFIVDKNRKISISTLYYAQRIKTAFKKRGFLCGYKPLLPARVSRRCFHFVQAIAFDSRQPSKGFIFYYFFFFAFSCLYACCSASENGFAYSFTLILSIAISCISCSRIYFATVASFNPTVLT